MDPKLGRVDVIPHDVARGVDTAEFGEDGPGEINCSEAAVAQQEAVHHAAGNQEVTPDNLAFSIDVDLKRRRYNRARRPGEIDGGERTLGGLVCPCGRLLPCLTGPESIWGR